MGLPMESMEHFQRSFPRWRTAGGVKVLEWSGSTRLMSWSAMPGGQLRQIRRIDDIAVSAV
jgi:hypothetical protein